MVQRRSRNVVARKDIESVRKQQGSELKQKTTEEREIICNEAGLKHSVHVSDDYTLAIKSSVGLNFNQMRRTKRILKEIGVSFDSEYKERMKRKHILKDRIRAENVICEEKNVQR